MKNAIILIRKFKKDSSSKYLFELTAKFEVLNHKILYVFQCNNKFGENLVTRDLSFKNQKNS